jgi:hypothetical protein
MGGGLSLTFPGYHIFVSYIMLMSGMPDYLAHSLVVAFFSSLIVLCAFLIVRALQSESAALIVAFLVAISRFDIEMLLWGGYPNVITLMLIPLTFYLFLQRERFSTVPFLITTTILSASIFLTHSLSAMIFAITTFATVILASIFSKRVGETRTHVLIWLLPLFLGAILISPFLIQAVPAYLSNNAQTFSSGLADIRLALLSTRVLPLELILPPVICVPFFFFFSKKYHGRFFTVPSILIAMWILVPALFTQGFLVGFYTDYNRFLYFVVLPVIMLIGMGIDHGSGFFARVIDTYLSFTKQIAEKTGKAASRLMPYLSRKNLYSGFVLGLVLFAFLAVPIFVTPPKGIEVQSFYQVMTDQGYEAIQWARQNTPTSAVFASDAYYGWWLSGFAQRQTLSAVDPQYLTLAREFEPAQVAKNLLDTDYMIDNGLIQVREDGGYVGRHNPMFLAELNWTYFPYAFFHFNNSETTVFSRIGDAVESYDLTQLPVKEMYLENDSDHASIVIIRGNDFLNCTQKTTVYQGIKFVNMSITVESDVANVSLDWVRFILNMRGEVTLMNSTVGLFDNGVKALGQLIFIEKQPSVYVVTSENPSGLELMYNLQGNSTGAIQFLVGAFSVSDNLAIYQDPNTKANYINKILADNLNSPLKKIADLPLNVFDYRQAMRDWNISYIACRDSELMPKFARDPEFSLVFINDEVAVFMVKRDFS